MHALYLSGVDLFLWNFVSILCHCRDADETFTISIVSVYLGVESIFASEGKMNTSEAERLVETVTLMPEYLVVCCWRNVKEVSLLLGQLTFEAPITTPDTSVIGLLTVQQVLLMIEKFSMWRIGHVLCLQYQEYIVVHRSV